MAAIAQLEAPAEAPAAAEASADPEPGWPCHGCGAVVPLAADACSQCGRPFLDSDGMPSLSLPVVGNVARLETPQKAALMFVGAIVVCAVLVAFAFIAGAIL